MIRAPLASLMLLAGLGAMPAAAQQRNSEFEVWPGGELYVGVARRLRAVAGAGASTDYERSFTELQVSASLDWAFRGAFVAQMPAGVRFTPPWYVRVGYRLADRLSGLDGEILEHRLTAEATVRTWVPGPVLVSVRAGADYRILPGANTWRLRPRLRADTPVHVGGLSLAPYASVEPIWDSRLEAFFRTRYQAGTEIRLARPLVLNIYYAYQHNDRTVPRHVHGIGSVLMLFL